MLRRFMTLSLVASLFLMVLAPASQAQPTSDLLTDVPVTGELSDGGTFDGLLTITGFSFEDGQLLASGLLEGTATEADGTVTEVTQEFNDVVVEDLLAQGPGSSCDILILDLGPINLDLLGLTVDLSAIDLDVRGERGPGNLLGNLLCSVAGLLDNGATSGLSNLIASINDLLGGLLG